MLKSNSQYSTFVRNYLRFFMEQTDCISVSEANELQTEKRRERGEKTQFHTVFEISCIIPLEYHLSPYSSSVESWQVMLNINLCPWGKTSAAFKTLTNWFSTNSLALLVQPNKTQLLVPNKILHMTASPWGKPPNKTLCLSLSLSVFLWIPLSFDLPLSNSLI